MKSAWVVALILVLAACRTAPIVPSRPIAVPRGLELADVEIAVLAAIAGAPPAALLRQRMASGGDMEEVRLAALSSRYPTGEGWILELVEPGEIWASYHRGRHRLNVAIRFTESDISTRITGSEYLKQGDGKIHKNALVWRDQLNARIDQSLKTVYAVVDRRRSAVGAGPPSAAP